MTAPRIDCLSAAEKDALYQRVLHVLEHVGVGVGSASVLSLLAEAGARVDEERRIAKLPPALVENCLAQAPRQVRLAGRDPAHDLVVGDGSPLACTTDGMATMVMDDLTGEVRGATRADLAYYFGLFDALPELDFIWTTITGPDFDAVTGGLETDLIALESTSKHVQSIVAHSPEQVPPLLEMLEAIAGAPLHERPIYSSLHCPVSPLQFESDKLDASIELARHGVPINIHPLPLMGSTAPMSILGSAVTGIAEFLAGVVIFQLAAPGCALTVVATGGATDLRTGGYLCGAPEVALLDMVCLSMSTHFGLPSMGSGDQHGGQGGQLPGRRRGRHHRRGDRPRRGRHARVRRAPGLGPGDLDRQGHARLRHHRVGAPAPAVAGGGRRVDAARRHRRRGPRRPLPRPAELPRGLAARRDLAPVGVPAREPLRVRGALPRERRAGARRSRPRRARAHAHPRRRPPRGPRRVRAVRARRGRRQPLNKEHRKMETQYPTRMGDGSLTRMTRSELRAELEEGTLAAASRAKVPPLSADELDHLLDIWASPAKFSAVDIGDEVVLTYDGSGSKTVGTRTQDLLIYEQMFGADSVELGHVDYSFKAIRTILPFEAQSMKDAQAVLTVPVMYGAMPNLGLYSQPDGPVPNWSELLPLTRVDEARAAQEEAVGYAVEDMVKTADALWEAGADGIDFDTAGAAGDGDFLATLLAIERIRAAHPDMGIQVGMAGEFVLGMHGRLEYDGVRLAGLWPRGQMELVRRAGATIYGPAVNVNTRKSGAWNIARALTLVKPCMDVAEIPVHMNIGMGVGAVPISSYLPLDAVSRASRATVDILRLDGL